MGLINEFFDEVLALADMKRPPSMTTGDGRTWVIDDHTYKLVWPALAGPVRLSSLTGFCQFLDHHAGDLSPMHLAVVNSHRDLSLLGPLDPVHRTREVLATAQFEGVTHFHFGSWMGQEEFSIGVQRSFEEGGEKGELLKVVGNVKTEAVGTSQDDGVSQVATFRKGAASVEAKTCKPLWGLRPYRTWPEIGQPLQPFLLRIKVGEGGAAELALFEVEDPRWKGEACMRAAHFVREGSGAFPGAVLW